MKSAIIAILLFFILFKRDFLSYNHSTHWVWMVSNGNKNEKTLEMRDAVILNSFFSIGAMAALFILYTNPQGELGNGRIK
jgi:hypothetical protein